MPLQVYLLCLLMTIAIELPAWRFVLKRRGFMADIALMNVVTNPAANVLFWALAIKAGMGQAPALLLVEALVIAAEWAMLTSLGAEKPFLSSLVLNGLSWGLGTLILELGGFLS